jgi:hypothetical protein
LHDVRSAVRADYDIAKKLRPILRIFRRSLERSGGKRAQNEKKQEDGNGENMFPVQPSSSFAPAAGEYQGGDYRFLERSTLVLSEEANQVKSRRIFFAYRAKREPEQTYPGDFNRGRSARCYEMRCGRATSWRERSFRPLAPS